jgi:protein-L-isoaspartate(D-aspartate) O-methyltransferase
MKNDKEKSRELLNFFVKLDRSIFIEKDEKKYAKYDSALPIGFEQTISQPSLVYRMTLELDIDENSKVLEIGTGSGYQTAFLAQFAKDVYTIERIEELSRKAQKRLSDLGYRNINFKISNGSEGWPEFSPFDRIIVTAAASAVPKAFIEQLKPDGKMIIPVGEREIQKLLLIRKDSKGSISMESLGKVVFVELKGDYGWKH